MTAKTRKTAGRVKVLRYPKKVTIPHALLRVLMCEGVHEPFQGTLTALRHGSTEAFAAALEHTGVRYRTEVMSEAMKLGRTRRLAMVLDHFHMTKLFAAECLMQAIMEGTPHQVGFVMGRIRASSVNLRNLCAAKGQQLLMAAITYNDEQMVRYVRKHLAGRVAVSDVHVLLTLSRHDGSCHGRLTGYVLDEALACGWKPSASVVEDKQMFNRVYNTGNYDIITAVLDRCGKVWPLRTWIKERKDDLNGHIRRSEQIMNEWLLVNDPPPQLAPRPLVA